jgi:two-component system, response regulator, stage 0 sporulation protein F
MTRALFTPSLASRSHLRQRVPSPPHSRRRLILVADDDRDMRLWVACSLRSVGYDVVECNGGVELLERLGSAVMNRHEVVDAVITDVRMPGFTGLQVLEGLERAHRTTPVVLMTAYALELGEVRARNHPAVEVLTKPFDLDDLFTAIARITLRRPRETPRLGAEHAA